jgi:hypothetical protein
MEMLKLKLAKLAKLAKLPFKFINIGQASKTPQICQSFKVPAKLKK